MKYIALTRLFHSQSKQYIEPMQPVDLGHLSKEQIESLIASEYIKVDDGKPVAQIVRLGEEGEA